MNRTVLVTSGGTAEQIDSVRAITNNASGSLGALTATAFCNLSEVGKVYYLAPRSARQPASNHKLAYVEITSSDTLVTAIRRCCTAQPVDAIIHAMAVSDYQPSSVTTIDDLAAAVYAHSPTFNSPAELATAIRAIKGFERNRKISSTAGDLVIITAPTQKVIALLRPLAPQAVIVGFKLLTGVSHSELLQAANGVLSKNDCNYVLANDTADISSTCHVGYLIDRHGSEQRFETKEHIATGLVAATRKLWKEGSAI
ncbi:MAG: hypothetical protein LBJ43_00415 [Propionibacteriaceae bacterium]|jgi:phosphopantothenate-cysteine ligase|nr:hypothetical protein [Propionibacteriaceae bacterium]